MRDKGLDEPGLGRLSPNTRGVLSAVRIRDYLRSASGFRSGLGDLESPLHELEDPRDSCSMGQVWDISL